MEKIADVVQR